MRTPAAGAAISTARSTGRVTSVIALPASKRGFEPRGDPSARVSSRGLTITGGIMKSHVAAVITIALFLTVTAQAQVPQNIAAQLRELGPSVCVPETAKIYKPLLMDQ